MNKRFWPYFFVYVIGVTLGLIGGLQIDYGQRPRKPHHCLTDLSAPGIRGDVCAGLDHVLEETPGVEAFDLGYECALESVRKCEENK